MEPPRSRRLGTYTVNIPDDGRNTRQACAPSGHDADVFVGVLAEFTLAVLVVVQVGDRFAQCCPGVKDTSMRRSQHLDAIIKPTLDTCCRRVFERVLRERDARGARRRVGNVSDLGGTLTKVGPFVRRGVGEAVRHSTVGTVDDTSATGVLDARHSLFIGVHGLREETGAVLGLVAGGITKDLYHIEDQSNECMRV